MTARVSLAQEWRAVPGYEGRYEVSDQGRVRSLPRVDRIGRPVPGGLLAAWPDSGGYITYRLWADGRCRTDRAHVLVMAAFEGPCPDGLEVRHLDGDPAHNTRANLAYGTPSQNNHDRVRHGTHPHAAKTHCPQDHPLDGVSTTSRGTPRRYCLTCHRERSAQWRAAKKAQVRSGS